MSLFLIQDPFSGNIHCYSEEEAYKSGIQKDLFYRVTNERDLQLCIEAIERRKIVTPVEPIGLNIFENVAQNCANNDLWHRSELLGKGVYGAAYVACDCNYVLKMQQADYNYQIEIQALSELQKTDFVPKLYAAWICDGIGYFVIEKLNKCEEMPEEELFLQVKSALDKIYDAGWLHVDLYRDNIMCRGNKVVLIDFGWAAKRGNSEEQVYPDHPLSGPERYGKPVPWYFLDAIQSINLVENFPIKSGKLFNDFEKYKENVTQNYINLHNKFNDGAPMEIDYPGQHIMPIKIDA